MVNISVIIPTCNRELQLTNLLKSFLTQQLSQEEFEVIVVENGTSNNTLEVVQMFDKKFKYLNYFFENKPGLHNARHRGLNESKSDILVFCDDDIEASPSWLSSIKNSFLGPSIMLVGGRVLPKFEKTPPIWIQQKWREANTTNQILGYLSLIDLGDKSAEINPHYVFGCNFSIRKQVLLECGGFHPDGIPQELIRYRGDGETSVSNFIKDKGFKTLYHPDATVYHIISKDRLTLEYFKRRAFNQGVSDSFTNIRSSYYGNVSVNSKTRFLSNQMKFIKNMVNIFSIDKKSLKIEWEIAKSHKQGYRYHQREVKEDQELFKWVIKENYME